MAQRQSQVPQNKAEVLQIPDLKTAMLILKDMGVETKGKGIRNKDDAVNMIMENFNKGAVLPPKPVKAEPTRGLRKAIEDDMDNKNKLISKYEAVRKFCLELPPSYKKDLNSVFGAIDKEFDSRMNVLKKSECTILVVGETAAGKSSLINLLLGGIDLLPTSQLGCTSTIVEIRKSQGEKKEAIAFHRSLIEGGKKAKKAPLIFDLNSDKGIQNFRKAVQDSDEEGDSPYDRIEVSWPLPMLEEGIAIVDTPGIGGGAKMSKYAERYLSKSYGFIYVVNSANAGGVQKGRLQNFLRLVVNAAGDEGFNTESTMFICNRWDMIPNKDKNAVAADTFEKLSRFYSSLRKSQVHYMSITEAMKGLQYQTILPEYTVLLEMVEKILPNSLRARLHTHYRWLSAILKRALYSLKVSKVMDAKSMDKIKEDYEQVKKQIDRLEQNSRDRIDYLKHNIKSESEMIAKDIIGALQSRQMAERLFDWRKQDCPGTDDKKKVAKEAFEKIGAKIALEINHWERANSVVHGIKDKIVKVFKRDFELLEGQVARLEGAFLDGDTKTVKDLHQSIKKPAPVKHLWKKAKDASMDEDSGSFKGLGGAISTVSGLTASDKTFKKIFGDYKVKDTQKCVTRMQDATKLYLESICDTKNFQDKLNKFFSRFVKGIDAVAKMIPDFLKADMQLIEILQDQMNDTENNLRETYPKLIHQSHLLLGQLDLFFVNYIMVFDYSLDDIEWDPQDAPVGSGSFADVYIADVKDNSRKSKKSVAMKVCRDALKENTVSDILLEDRTLRELDHPNVVKYFGATYRFRDKRRQKDMQWIMVMEVCQYTMKQKFVNPDVNNPGKLQSGTSSQMQAMVTMADFALQLCSGLKYLHDKGFVHRDLKLENILVTEQNVVKLTDVGLAKQTLEIAFSIVGSPVYMAPEVLLQTENYDSKADIYSLAIILWEMWYGKDAADYIQQQLFGPLEKAIKEGLRPSLNMSTKPPQPWLEVIAKSWEYEPAKRPSTDYLCDFFDSFLQKSQRM